MASSDYTASILAAFAALLLWRLYRFTIVPIAFPNDPKEYPYWVPVAGHLRAFFQNSSRLLDESRLYFKDTREPYALSVAGQKWYIITSPSDVASIYKIKDGSLSYDIFVEEVMYMIGITRDGVRKAYQTQGADGKPCKHLVGLCKEYQITQLSPGTKFEELSYPAVEYILKHLDFDRIFKKSKSVLSHQGRSITVSLYHLISEIFIGLGQNAYYGQALGEIEPEMINHFMIFDHLAWQVLYQYPSFLSGKMLGAKAKMHAAFERYFSIPVNERQDAAWMILELEKEMKRSGVSLHDMSLFFFQLYWSVCGNIKKGPFWMLSYMLFDPTLLSEVRQEILPALSPGKIDIDYLCNSCPRLEALWDETLRKTAFAASVRFLTEDVTLPSSSLVLRKGNRVMMPQRQLHYNKSVFGDDVASFSSGRFLKNPKLKKNGSYRPFGGGATLCPGRHLAKITSFAFVAVLVGKFDIGLEGKHQQFPVPTEGNPSIGLVDVTPGTDLRVVLQPKLSI
ncbi:cytochrome P450 [Corynespora cassiicola Philippines]|uniref:Cytochrome P450 n=1 Tax=Corynespora cassiicola Philippines TaxID=1448308 RepID=A0A2T2NJA4_CORCC|nr:cytochrome P450 [Corynespora cassiicola Philippines]